MFVAFRAISLRHLFIVKTAVTYFLENFGLLLISTSGHTRHDVRFQTIIFAVIKSNCLDNLLLTTWLKSR